jgi:hypothetical protein
MIQMKGIQFVIDDSGKRKAVIIDPELGGELWENFFDLVVAESRNHKETISWEAVDRP